MAAFLHFNTRMVNVLSIVGAAAIGVAGMWLFGAKAKSEPPPQPPLMSIESMGHLTTVKVSYANVIEFTEKLTQGIPWTQWELHLGGTKVLLVARGDCLIGTDLRTAKYENTSETDRKSELVLSAPKPISARVSHDSRENGGSYFYAISGAGLELLIPGSGNRSKAIDTALGRAQQEITRACSNSDVITTAKKNSEAILKPAFAAIGWDIKIRWLQ